MWLVLPALALGQELANLSPQAGLLVLRNGQVMRGEITRVGDHYIVTIGVGGEVKIAASEVEVESPDLEAAYDWKLRRLSGDGAKPHLDLAEWCLRHHLHRRCAEQLSLALANDPKNPRIEQIDRRLQSALNAPAPPKPTASSAAMVGPEQLDTMLRELPKGTLERFTTIVQPMLNNRCATNQCHGGTSTNEFRLLRPPAGIGSPQRFTHRNLHAVLQFVNRDDPANSLILTKPQEPHGGASDAVFDLKSKSQLHELTVWVEQLAHRKEQLVLPSTIDARSAQLSTPLRAVPGNEAGATAATGNLPADQSADAKLAGNHLQKPTLPASTSSPDNDRWQPRDPFDPEIFNRRRAAKQLR
ncbi:hypothetical protein ETAA8_49270 [Anatilimnocola aggregata]|uniref:Secreted protein n=2 Tax=Anatilimnocola aggregata TaxID=2528021 RepID=A0A517YHX7_9BACT|nr:hypothetical protein ETAA8_49270 [Anatilimnocola aggregata]